MHIKIIIRNNVQNQNYIFRRSIIAGAHKIIPKVRKTMSLERIVVASGISMSGAEPLAP